jgi:hypothetical protein
MRVFISYGAPAGQVTVLTLAKDWQLDPEAAQKLNDAEVVLGVVGTRLSEACRQELNAGISLHKHMIVMSHPAFVPPTVRV